MTWTRVLAVSVAAFALWVLLDAPTLENDAQVSPVGARRTVALDLLGPVASLSRSLGLSHLVSVGDGAIRRTGNRPGAGSPSTALGAGNSDGPAGHGASLGPSAKVGDRSTAPTTVPGPAPLRRAALRPTPADPLKMLMLGDSLGIDLGKQLVNDLTNTGVVQATLDGEVGTGLTRPDYFDWPSELQQDLLRDQPDVVVVMIGANDAQDFPGPPDIPYGSAQWASMYGQRVATFMREATSRGAHVLWVGMPPMQNPGLSTDMATLDALDRAQAQNAPGVTFLSSWTLIGTPAGTYTPYLQSNGQNVNVREPDGTHIAPGGAEILSQAVIATLHSALHVALPGT
jgi:hypothetical protein